MVPMSFLEALVQVIDLIVFEDTPLSHICGAISRFTSPGSRWAGGTWGLMTSQGAFVNWMDFPWRGGPGVCFV